MSDHTMQIGEGFSGSGPNAAHVNTVLGAKEGPVGVAWTTALATPRHGFASFVVVAAPNVPVKPMTLFVDFAYMADTALIEEGTQSVVFVAANVSGKVVTRRSVALVSHGQDVAFVRSQPTDQEKAQGCEPLKPGEWVVVAGGMLLDGALDGALATAPSERESAKN